MTEISKLAEVKITDKRLIHVLKENLKRNPTRIEFLGFKEFIFHELDGWLDDMYVCFTDELNSKTEKTIVKPSIEATECPSKEDCPLIRNEFYTCPTNCPIKKGII